MKRLQNKVAVVYGNGATGGAIAKAFANEGAKVFLAGRTRKKLEAIKNDIESTGGQIYLAEVDALNEQAVKQHVEEIIKTAGRINISYNAIGIAQTGIQGPALTDLSLENFSLPMMTYPQSHFLTARSAARHMMKQG